MIATYEVKIYCGLRENYTGPLHTIAEVEDLVQKYVDVVGLGVTVTPTTFVYRDGREPGVIVGFINYPRFPSSPAAIHRHAMMIGHILRDSLKQLRVTLVSTDGTIMLESY